LEAAIRIEPMNKGFAVLTKLFAQDRLSVHTRIFINLLVIPVRLRSPKFAHLAIASDPRVTKGESARAHRDLSTVINISR
jgi:hypothetical protein